MRLLFITYGSPWPATTGARIRDSAIIEAARKDFAVTVLALYESAADMDSGANNKPKDVELRGVVLPSKKVGAFAHMLRSMAHSVATGKPLATAPYRHKQFERLISTTLQRKTYDIVQIEHSMLAPYRTAIPGSFGGRTIIDLHNVAANQYRSMVACQRGLSRIVSSTKAWLMRKWEAEWVQMFDGIIVVSGREKDLLVAMGVEAARIEIIPNGVAVGHATQTTQLQKHSLLFVGTLGYLPNRDAVRYMSEEILPLIHHELPNSKLRIVGSGKRFITNLPGVESIGVVPNLTPEYERTSVVVAPLRAGGGTRLKILEAIAHKRVVVATPLAAEGLNLRCGEGIVFAADPGEFSQKVIALLRDPERKKSIAEAGYKRIVALYDWKLISDTYRNNLLELAARSS